MSIQALREQRAAKAKEASELANKKTWNRTVDGPVYDTMMDEIQNIDDQIKRIEQSNKETAERAQVDNVAERSEQRGKDEKSASMTAFAAFLRKDFSAMSEDEQQAFRNTMSTTTGSQGGYTVPTEIAATVVDRLAKYGNMRQYATVLRGNSGNDMNWPTSDGTSEIGEIVAQNVSAAAADISFGSVTISTYKFSSKVVAVPFELLQDSVVDIEAFVGQRLAKRLGRITNQKFTVGAGSGSSEPMGVVTAAPVGRTGAAGQVATILWDDLVELEHSVDVAYREEGDCRFMGHDSMIKTIKKIKDTAGRPIFIPGYADGYAGGFKDTVLGYEVATNNSMATPAASAKSLVFGDIKEYIIRDVMDMQIFRFSDSAYTKLGQVGFLAWMRSGGNLTDVNAVATYQHPAS
jgi:HK97 family phage major capsid protein